jgi:hypothetical protein
MLAMKYYPRFGQIAVDMGFVTAEQLKEALTEQISNDPSIRLRPRKLIGEIFFEKGWMTVIQIKIVLAEVFKDKQ